MPNAFIPRDRVHAMSEAIGDAVEDHQAAFTRLLKEQRRISRFFEENAGSTEGITVGIGMYLLGVICRMVDLEGGRLKSATWAQVREAERRVGAEAPSLLPFDEGFTERVRQVAWRAQPHVLDEAMLSLFDREPEEDEPEMTNNELLKLFFLVWVAVEVLDVNWRPPREFEGETSYTYVHIEPRAKKQTDEA